MWNRLLYLAICLLLTDAIMPYMRRYSYMQSPSNVAYAHRQLSAWKSDASNTNQPTSDMAANPASDSVLFTSTVDEFPSQGQTLPNALPPDLTAIDPESYYADWHHLLLGHQSKRCHTIPRNMTLCNQLDYNRMVLPNYLQHEDLKEAVEQSLVWVSLAHLECHPGLRKFLCSLYAPVCVEHSPKRIIEPCQELCEDVRQRCLPTMLQFGFGWPQIVNCTRFPLGSTKMCIPLTDNMMHSKCSGCVEDATFESVVSSFCVADIAMRTRITRISRANNSSGSALQIRPDRRIKAFKLNIPMRKLMHLNVEVSCGCDLLEKAIRLQKWHSGKWLIMGKLMADGKTLQVEHLSRIQRHNSGLRRAIRAMRRPTPALCQLSLPNAESSQQSNLEQQVGRMSKPSSTSRQERTHRARSNLKREAQYQSDDSSIITPTKTPWLEPRFRSKYAPRLGRRVMRDNTRRSLVRRSQYIPPYPGASFDNKPSPSRAVTHKRPITGNRPRLSIPSIPNSMASAKRVDSSKHSTDLEVGDSALLETENDLFAPQNLLPWL